MKKIIIANWKMNLTKNEAKNLVNKVKDACSKNVVICPPYIYLDMIADSNITIGAQDVSCYKSDQGSYTGEISAKMLKNVGCTYCIVGHSERRFNNNENNENLKRKLEHLYNQDIKTIFCIGESLDDRENGRSIDVLTKQLKESLTNKTSEENTIIAYEPIWAIGTGKSAETEDIFEIVKGIRSYITKEFEQNLKIVYGGSVNSSNIEKILNIEQLSGVLIGSASLDGDEFIKIIRLAD